VTTTPERVAPPAAEPGAEALIREARRRQHRRWLVAGLAAAVVIGGSAAVLAASTGGHRRPPGPRVLPVAPAHVIRPAPGLILTGSATTVAMWPNGPPDFTPTGGPPAYVDDLTTGHLSQRQIPGIAACDCQPYVIGVGGRLVYVGGGGTTAIPADLKGGPRVLGSTQFFAPSSAPGHVWLIRFRGGYLGQRPVTVRSVPVAGGRPGPVTRLPSGAADLVEGTDAGLLLELRGRSGRLALWHPGTAPQVLPYSPSLARGFAVTARLVAYGTGCHGFYLCTVLRVLNVVTGRLSSFVAPPGTAGWEVGDFGNISFTKISPNHQMIAAYAAPRPPRHQARLYLLGVGSGRVTAVPASAVPWGANWGWPATAWSVRGSWLLYQGPRSHLWAYQVTSGKTRASTTPCCLYTAMVTAAAHPAVAGQGGRTS
jgi:hypothetical protein